jgi:hypothetical protein
MTTTGYISKEILRMVKSNRMASKALILDLSDYEEFYLSRYNAV